MYTKPQTAMEDLSYDFDVRGDYALFIEEKHFTSDDDLDEETKNEFLNCEATFFRVIDNGDLADHTLPGGTARKVRRGKQLLILQAGSEPGDLIISASADGLRPSKVKIKTKD